MKNNASDNFSESNNINLNVQNDDVSSQGNCKPDSILPRIEEQCCSNGFNIDSSLLFFFLILICIFKNSNCNICLDTLLFFFLLLVLILNNCCEYNS